MNWIKSNPFLTGFIVVVAMITAALGYFLNNAYSTYATVSEEYDTQVGKLQQLQNRAPFPNAENNEAFSALLDEYASDYNKLLTELTEKQIPLESISPQAFQDRLRAVVSEVQAAAESKGVVLPDDFYLGFDQYQGTLPSDAAAGPLARQMAAIKSIVDRLIEFRVASITSIDRTPLPQERGGTPPPDRNRSGGDRDKKESPEIAAAFPFEISFVTEQGRLRQVLNAAVNSEHFFIIRNLMVTNSELNGPSRNSEFEDPSGAAAFSQTGSASSETPETTEVKGLDVIVGREKLAVSALIELLTFTPPTPTAQATPNP